MILNQLITLIIIGTFNLTILDNTFLLTNVENLREEVQHNLLSERRSLESVELASNTRSYINVANGIEFNEYDI